MSSSPSGSFHQALKKVPLMRVAYKIGLFIRNYMKDDRQISASSFLKKQKEILEDFQFADTFEVIMLLFMLSRYGYLEHIHRDQGYQITNQLIEEFPPLDEWLESHDTYLDMLEELECREQWLEIMFRPNTWIYQSRLISLDLHDLLIKKIKVDTFDTFTHLRKIYLNRNLLAKIPTGVFDKLTKLEKIDISSNMISELPIHVFANNTKLRSINLSDNGIDNNWLLKFRTLNRLTHKEIEIII